MQWFLKQHNEGVQPIVNRALLSLPHHKHIKFISQTAILEFKCGVPDRGRSLFEGILRQYPKRTDLWSIYLDQVSPFGLVVQKPEVFSNLLMSRNLQEMKLGDTDVIRALFERATSLSLPLKKIKVGFN